MTFPVMRVMLRKLKHKGRTCTVCLALLAGDNSMLLDTKNNSATGYLSPVKIEFLKFAGLLVISYKFPLVS